MSCYYEIIPENTYEIIRNCGGCGCKMKYRSTGKFRVNANGNKLDVWLIYQCEKCKHTYNLPIYERVNPLAIDKEEYQKFLSNDSLLAFQYANNRKLLTKNHCKLDDEGMTYEIKKYGSIHSNELLIKNPYGLKVRMDKLIAQIMDTTRSGAKKMLEEEKIQCHVDYEGQYIIDYLKEIG